MNDVGFPQIVEACPACGTLIDVSAESPFSQIHCPSCGQGMRARKQFNNFTLLDLIGQGGMGSVFKAIDCNLNRQVALKILRREISGDAGEREKLAEEARRTATINHPHVVKVFNFGEDRGQFYLAMELVEKGSLDDLMSLQRRVAEIQILDVGIQIASGLQAALESGLIHRDIKPGNILFSEARTAKLVDFGLALVADEVAAQRGEIWGTPYYIAPEKLDQGPEDFRSDIYSLGGTLFHALAGRPPYEAETASMVALKQLKSQEVSLQAFAPDVSSETAYVINRMMRKNPDERYEHYEELIAHFTYAKEKLAQRLEKPRAVASKRVVVESQQQRMVVGALTLVIAAALVAAIIGGFFQREQIAEALGIRITERAGFNPRDAAPGIVRARSLAADLDFPAAVEILEPIAASTAVPQPTRNWARFQLGLNLLGAGEIERADAIFEVVRSEGLFSNNPAELGIASFFNEAARIMGTRPPIPPGTLRAYDNENYETFAFPLYAMRNWANGFIDEGGAIFVRFLQTEPAGDFAWVARLKPMARVYVEDFRLYERLKRAAAKAGQDPAAAAKALEDVRQSRALLQTAGAIQTKMDAIEADLEKVAGS